MYTRQHAIQRARFLKFDLVFGNKAVVHRRLRSRCCHLSSYFKRPKKYSGASVGLQWYYCER